VEAALKNAPKVKALSMDVSLTPFQWAVLEAVATIPFGQRRAYGAVASMVGKPLGARAVGHVMGRNPLPLIFPCHRVVAAGGLGGFGSGLDVKRYLLNYEAGL
jgi:O-6-methylguanine DNA methyltransferase